MNKAKQIKFGQNVQYQRKLNKLSQEDLAELIGKSRNYIGMVERAEVNTPVSVIFDLACALKCSVCDLFLGL